LQLVGGVEEGELFLLGGQRLGLRDHLLAHHRIEDLGLPQLGPSRVDQWAVIGWRLWQAGEHRRLAERQGVRGGVEEAARGSFGPVTLRAVINGVEVELEDLVLRIAAIEVDGEHGLSDFALDGGRWVRTDEDLLDQLLADGAAALRDVAMR